METKKDSVNVLDWLELLLGKAEGIIQIDPNIQMINNCSTDKLWCKPDYSERLITMT